MSRITVHHLTRARRLPLIEEEGLRTRADLSAYFGDPDEFDRAAPGAFAHGKRVSAYLLLDTARQRTEEHGPGLVTFTVDPRKALAVPAERRAEAPDEYWAAARPLAEYLAEDGEDQDLDVHQNVPVRAKYLTMRAPLTTEEDLGGYAPLVAEVADEDRLSAKALMHLAIIAAEGDFESAAFKAACALAWRDEPDPPGLMRELLETDPDKVASAALAMYGADAAEVVDTLRTTLDETREWADENGVEHGQGLLARTSLYLDELPRHVA